MPAVVIVQPATLAYNPAGLPSGEWETEVNPLPSQTILNFHSTEVVFEMTSNVTPTHFLFKFTSATLGDWLVPPFVNSVEALKIFTETGLSPNVWRLAPSSPVSIYEKGATTTSWNIPIAGIWPITFSSQTVLGEGFRLCLIPFAHQATIPDPVTGDVWKNIADELISIRHFLGMRILQQLP